MMMQDSLDFKWYKISHRHLVSSSSKQTSSLLRRPPYSNKKRFNLWSL